MKKRSDGRYQKKITLPDGRIKYLYSTAKTQAEANRDFNKQMLSLEEKKQKSLLFSNVAKQWNEQYRESVPDVNYRKNTRAAYLRTLSYFEDDYINNITPKDVARFISWLALQKYSAKTVASHKSILNMVFKYAIVNGYTDFNPVEHVDTPANLPRKARELPSDEELRIVNSNYEGFDFLPYFLLNTGLRMSEALPLDLEKDFDFDNMIINVDKHLIHDGNKPVIENVTKTKNAVRSVILLDRVAEKLPKRRGLLFCNEDGSPLTKKQLQCRWEAYKKKYGVSVTAHQLRHGYATMLFEAGVDVKDAQELMGHADINMTRQIYTHIRDKRKTETAKKLNSFNFS